MRREGLVRLGGIAAVLGGLAWVVKGAVILATGRQPPLLFEAAPLFLAVGLVGLSGRLPPKRSSRQAGAVLAVVSICAWLVSVGMPVADGEFSPALLVNSVALLAGLIVLGVGARRYAVFGSRAASSLPLWLGIGTFPALAVGGALGAIDERLLEVPLVLIGAMWASLGVLITRVGRPVVARSEPAPSVPTSAHPGRG